MCKSELIIIYWQQIHYRNILNIDVNKLFIIIIFHCKCLIVWQAVQTKCAKLLVIFSFTQHACINADKSIIQFIALCNKN